MFLRQEIAKNPLNLSSILNLFICSNYIQRTSCFPKANFLNPRRQRPGFRESIVPARMVATPVVATRYDARAGAAPSQGACVANSDPVHACTRWRVISPHGRHPISAVHRRNRGDRSPRTGIRGCMTDPCRTGSDPPPENHLARVSSRDQVAAPGKRSVGIATHVGLLKGVDTLIYWRPSPLRFFQRTYFTKGR